MYGLPEASWKLVALMAALVFRSNTTTSSAEAMPTRATSMMTLLLAEELM